MAKGPRTLNTSQFGSKNFSSAYNGIKRFRKAKLKYDITLDELRLSCSLASISSMGDCSI